MNLLFAGIKMRRKINIPIKEDEENLLQLLKKEKNGRKKERLQFLYVLKTGQIRYIKDAVKLFGRNRNTYGDWVGKYESGGLKELLSIERGPGRQGNIQGENLKKLKARLSEPEGFNSYKDISAWMEKECGIKLPPKKLFYTCKIKLKASPKVARPSNPRQDSEEVEAFKKNFKSGRANQK